MFEADAELEIYCSDCNVFLNLSSCSCAVSDPLLPMWLSLIMFSSCCLSSSRRLYVDRPPALQSRAPSGHPLHLFLLELFSFLHSLSQRLYLCLHQFLPCPSKILSILILFRHSLLCGFVTLPCDASAAQPGQPPVWPLASSRILSSQPLGIPSLQSSTMGGLELSFSISTQEPPSALPVRSIPCMTLCLSRPTFASHNSPVLVVQKTVRS